jgi:hypothetical protein
VQGTAPGLEQEVITLLKARCISCHGASKPKAQLNLATLEGLARGSKNGLVIQPGKPGQSLLLELVQQDRMPPKRPLAVGERDLLRRWIAAGAPGLPTSSVAAIRSTHWAFQPPTHVVPPGVRQPERARNALDRFVLAALQRKNLSLAPEAERSTLLRRVSFDLTGLLPTNAEREAFLNDARPDADERVVEHYLASPHYGERWGKYWLDAAGYADSNGYFSADSDRPLAYLYRDYVIRSLNADKPYDQFVREQLAGDEIAGYLPSRDLPPTNRDLLIATHFLRNAPDGTGESDGNPDEVRTDRFTVLEGNLQVTMSCLLGVTIQCARCHAHKFEPIAHDEYYRLQAIFYPVYCPDRWVKPNDRAVFVGRRAEHEASQQLADRLQRQIQALHAGLDTIAAPLREQLLDERLLPLPAATRVALKRAVAVEEKKRSAEEKALLKTHAKAVQITDEDLAKRFQDYVAVRRSILEAVASREKQFPPPAERIAAIVETGAEPPVHHLLLRGQHSAPGPQVAPGVPAAFCSPGNAYRLVAGAEGQSSGRRLAFARWVTSPENPLFARVLVNRIWQHHFGVGLVATSNNLGQSGSRPSHPELLDYLALEMVRSGGSIKAIHRLIVLSATYRQSSAWRLDGQELDPENRLLWRFPVRRLDAEAVRDGMLCAAGELDTRQGGPYVPTQRLPEGNVEVDETLPDARRRSIYLQQRRTQVATLLELFDAPAIVGNCTFRTASTVPLQSLALLNSSFALARARALARRLEREVGLDTDMRVKAAFVWACGRPPQEEERAASRRFLARQEQVYAQVQDGGHRAWADFCQMLLASNAFLYVD